MSVGNRHDAEDLTTQTFLKMLEAIGRFRWQSAPFSAWLFRIAHNLAIDHFRAGKRVQPEDEVPEPRGLEESSAEEQAFDSIGRAGMLELIRSEDLTTQTFLKMLEAIGRFRWQSAPFSAWLFRIAHNLAIDHFRAGKRVQPEDEVPEPRGLEESSAEEQAFDSIGRAGMLELI